MLALSKAASSSANFVDSAAFPMKALRLTRLDLQIADLLIAIRELVTFPDCVNASVYEVQFFVLRAIVEPDRIISPSPPRIAREAGHAGRRC